MNISMDAVNGYIQSNASNSHTDKLQDKLNGNFKNSTDEELMEVCKEFEAYFVEQMFKAMKKMVPESEESDSSTGQLKDYFEDMMIQEYAKDATEGEGMGIAQMMYEQMKRNYDL